ncbi:MAG: type I methionyl aminopeptidase, partial [Planctomycetota bacterium]
MIMLKSPREIDLLREAGLIVAETLQLMREHARPGVTTAELDAVAEEHIRSRGAEPAFKGYRVPGVRFPYPASICASINEEVVHGIPGDRKLAEGDIISIDVGTRYKKYYGDAALTLAVGKVNSPAARLLAATEGALQAAIGAIRPDMPLRDLSRTIQEYAESRGFSVVRKFVGHGIGRQMHEDPQVPNFVGSGSPAGDVSLPAGTVIAIEPMLNEGG